MFVFLVWLALVFDCFYLLRCCNVDLVFWCLALFVCVVVFVVACFAVIGS